MSTERGTVYMLQDGTADDEWATPVPAADVITDAVVAATALEADDIDEIESYVDETALRTVVGDGDEDSLSFELDGHTVTVHSDGRVDVDTGE